MQKIRIPLDTGGPPLIYRPMPMGRQDDSPSRILDWALAHWFNGDIAQAEKSLDFIVEHRATQKALELLALVKEAGGDFDAALEFAEQAGELAANLKEQKRAALTKDIILAASGSGKTIEHLYRAIIEFRDPTLLYLASELALEYERFEAGMELCTRGIEYAEKQSELSLLTHFHATAATLSFNFGNMIQAHHCANTALKHSPFQANPQLAIILDRLKDGEADGDHAPAALSPVRQHMHKGRQRVRFRLYEAEAESFIETGRDQDAFAALTTATRLARGLKIPPLHVRASILMSQLDLVRGNFSTALKNLKPAMKKAVLYELPLSQFRISVQLARLAALTNKHGLAHSYLQKCVQICEKKHCRHLEGELVCVQSETALSMNCIEDAGKLARKAVRLCDGAIPHQLAVTARTLLGESLLSAQKPKEAIPHLSSAWARVGRKRCVPHPGIRLAMAYIALGEHAWAHHTLSCSMEQPLGILDELLALRLLEEFHQGDNPFEECKLLASRLTHRLRDLEPAVVRAFYDLETRLGMAGEGFITLTTHNGSRHLSQLEHIHIRPDDYDVLYDSIDQRLYTNRGENCRMLQRNTKMAGILEYFFTNQGAPITRASIFERIWNRRFNGEINNNDVYVALHKLRKTLALKKGKYHLISLPRNGRYRLNPLARWAFISLRE